MLAVPLYVFLFIYFAFLFVFATFFIVNLLHLTNTGTFTLSSFAVTIIIFGLSAIILLATKTLLQDALWQQPVVLVGSFSIPAFYNF